MNPKVIRLLVASTTTALLCVLLLSGLLLAAPVSPAAPATLAAPATDDVPRMVINEVMPKAGADGVEWIELHNTAPQPPIYLPMLLKNSTGSPSPGVMAGPISAQSPLAPEVSFTISGWQVVATGGNLFVIPDAMPLVPPNGYVLIRFDGLGEAANDYDFSDGKAVLHSAPGQVNMLADAEDFLALYSSATHSESTLKDYVSWGTAFPAEDHAVAAGLWPAGYYLEFAPNAGYVDPSLVSLRTAPDESVGRVPQVDDDWAVYRTDQLTPGAANPIPRPDFSMPPAGDTLDVGAVVIGWSAIPGATEYLFQIARDADFADLVVNTETAYPDYHHPGTLDPGTYYWRMRTRTDKGLSGWSGGVPFRTDVLAPGVAAAGGDLAAVQKTLGIVWQVQHKDTPSLDVSDANNKTGDGAWDVVHPADHRVSNHDNHYCQVASMAMINSYYGGDISQDRLSYYAIREYPDSKRGLDPDHACTFPADCRPGLEWDFWAGHNKGFEGIAWSLGYAWNDWSQIETYGYNPPTSTIPFNDIKVWIDNGRPLMVTIPGHAMVVDGYRTSPSDQVHLLNPWTDASWVPYTDNRIQRINWVGVFRAKGTAGAPPAPRSDEASITTDSDGDGVTDFDEVRRFHTNPLVADSDKDWVLDKQDILDTVYLKNGTYVWSDARRDTDNDGKFKEVDWDNDNDGTPDGCEDVNIDGEYDLGAGETDNFSASSRQDCVPRLNILYPLKTNKVNAGDPADPDKILVQVETKVPEGWSLYLPPSNFDVAIGGSHASVLAAYQSADSHFLVVDPPTQAAASFFDLDVTLLGQNDSEAQSVYYLPKTPNDAVMVVDRSGSMTSDNKMAAAKNAGAAFVDMLNNDDYVGVASFATTASANYGLSKITGDPVRDAAITAIDGLVADGWTALGQGVQRGYDLLKAANHTDHDWTMVLLSDGYENEAPNWAAIESGITGVIVHTVALGEDANRTLLQSIAGAKGGSYFYVDTNPPAPAPRLAEPLQALASPPLAVAPTLGNRLADTYVSAGELSQGWQRLWEVSGRILEKEQPKLTIPLGAAMGPVVFTLNWEDSNDYLFLELTGPDGNKIVPDQELRAATHHQLRINKPPRGNWIATIIPETGGVDYHLMVSGRAETTLHAAIGGDPTERGVGGSVPINAMLTDYREIIGAKIVALVQGPGIGRQVQLFDDGNHGDGEANDGWYAAPFADTNASGGYQVKLVAWGTNNRGEEFVRYAQAGFNVRHRAAYIWLNDQETAQQVEALMESSDWVVDRIWVNDVPKTNLDPYALLVIGPDTGYRYDWTNGDIAGLLNQKTMPVLGLGDGGAAYFSQLELDIGYGHTWVSDNNEVVAIDPPSAFWHEPYEVGMGAEVPLVLLYTEPLRELGVYIPKPTRLLIPIAGEEKDVNRNHYPVAMQISDRSFVLWGYNEGPAMMTPQGQRHFLDVTHVLRAP